MAILTWDNVGTRTYETGVDKGVLYLSNGSGVAWNGLTSVSVTKENGETTPIFYDGKKTLDLVNPGDFSGTINAITYPEEFNEYVGFSDFNNGLFVDNQPTKTFGLSYRTYLGNDLDGAESGYKIHVIYNVTAIPNDIAYETISDSTNPITFDWSITANPVFVAGHRHTAHFVIDSTKIHEEALSDIEDALYGTISTSPYLPTPTQLLSYVNLVITDNGNGTWTATGPDYYFSMLDTNTFQIEQANALTVTVREYAVASSSEYLDPDTLVASD